MSGTQRSKWLLVVIVLGVAGFGIFKLILPPGAQDGQPDTPTTEVHDEAWEFTAPEPRLADYVGSGVCAECHRQIADAYAGHPMANSCATITQWIEQTGFQGGEFTATDGRRYEVLRSASGEVVHRESLADQDGEIYAQAMPVSHVLGSGRHGRAFLAEHNGLLFQSPLTWYSQGARWDLSPGYDVRRHQRFERRIDDSCLYCHVGRLTASRDGPGTYTQPIFAEAVIGCERCHGPGARHVAFRRDEAADSSTTDPIVQPNRLSPAQRDAVCFVCHLQGRATFRRYGRGFFDFRPGDRVEDTLLIYLEGERIDEGQSTLPVSQVEQMLVSKCYRESEGRFTCTSCHDPHGVPRDDERDRYYRQKCLNCHTDADCDAPRSEREALSVPDSCVQCHMPALRTTKVAHTALTDHRVIRQPTGDLPPRRPGDPSGFRFFGDELRVPARERNRGRGLLLLMAAQGLRNSGFAQRALELFAPPESGGSTGSDLIDVFQQDPVTLRAIAAGFHMTRREREARRAWAATLLREPTSEEALFMLARSHLAHREGPEALEYLERLFEINPNAAEVARLRAQLLGQIGSLEDAIEATQKAIELNPTDLSLRALLEQFYRKAGQVERAEEQERLRRRLQARWGNVE